MVHLNESRSKVGVSGISTKNKTGACVRVSSLSIARRLSFAFAPLQGFSGTRMGEGGKARGDCLLIVATDGLWDVVCPRRHALIICTNVLSRACFLLHALEALLRVLLPSS